METALAMLVGKVQAASFVEGGLGKCASFLFSGQSQVFTHSFVSKWRFSLLVLKKNYVKNFQLHSV